MDEINLLKDEVRKLKIMNDIYYRENERLKNEYRILFDEKEFYVSKSKSGILTFLKRVVNKIKRIVKRMIRWKNN
jgi:hypothetical protein